MTDYTNEMKKRFEKAMKLFKALGFRGEVCVSAGIVMISSFDRDSSSMVRAGFKKAKSAGSGYTNEFKFGEKSVFTWVDSEMVKSKTEIREEAQKLVA